MSGADGGVVVSSWLSFGAVGGIVRDGRSVRRAPFGE